MKTKKLQILLPHLYKFPASSFSNFIFNVINDIAKRGVKLIEEYNNQMTKDKSQTRYLLRVVSGYRNKYPDHRNVTLSL